MPKNRIRRILKLAILVAFLSGCSERFTAYYPTYGDAQRRGAIQSGWIPEALPKTATEIFEQHDIDSNEVWIRFSVPSDEKEKITAGLRKLSQDETLKIKLRYPSKAKWWFEGLIQQSPANDNALRAYPNN